jgi:hypothetical protein
MPKMRLLILRMLGGAKPLHENQPVVGQRAERDVTEVCSRWLHGIRNWEQVELAVAVKRVTFKIELAWLSAAIYPQKFYVKSKV